MSGKWKGSYDREREYIQLWEDKFVWVLKATDGTENGFCKLFRIQIAPKASRLTDHEKSKAHASSASSTKNTERMPFTRVVKPENKDSDATDRTCCCNFMPFLHSVSRPLGGIFSKAWKR